jgi:flagellin-like hook-associated protein FlgL
MLSPTAPVYGNLASATSRALSGLQRSVGRLLEGDAAEKLLNKGDAGQHVYASRLGSEVKVKQAQITSLQNAVSFSHAQKDALNVAMSIFSRMGELAVKATDVTLTYADRRNLDLEFNELRDFSNEIGDEKMLDKGLFRSNGGGSEFGAGFGYSATTDGGFTSSNTDDSGCSIIGFRAGGTAYWNADPIGVALSSSVTHIFATSGAGLNAEGELIGIVGSVNQVKEWQSLADNPNAETFRYTDQGVNYEGNFNDVPDPLTGYKPLTVVDSAEFAEEESELQVVAGNQSVYLQNVDLPEFSEASGLNLLSESNASSAVTTLNSYVEQLGAQKALLGSNLSELELSIDRLGQQVFAGKVSLDRMTDEEMAEDLIRLSRDKILSQGNIALMTQARGINQNLVDTLL